MQSQYIDSLREGDLREILHNIPVVPLPPRDRVGSVVGRPDIERPDEVFTVQIKGDLPSSIGSVQKGDGVDTGFFGVYGHVEPFSRHRPAHIEQTSGWGPLLIRVVVDLVV